MQLRALKRHHDARTLERARIWAPDRFDVDWHAPIDEDDYWDDDQGPERDATCPQCGGSGRDEWNDGILPCERCDGEGYDWWR